ncbi:putative tail component of prophage [Sinorhizobium sojae CCBAU 05684]|uniref:Putative tail component of prophage n=1 Tax=Sinorhizobium sojae CCBAU 05684 TaxID=716928 RepID=A0A249P9V7_9HYPH|nr:phage tail length tape measure family protein [Sinorhizobium sojae]ASY62532.1 putative tail component of prophage [Sinorhizobium sojae CCBAU 05684]
MERGVSIFIDPSGAQTGGRVVKRELKEIGDAAIGAQKMTDQLTRAQQEMAKSAQASAQALTQQQDALRAKFNPTFAVLQRYKQVQDEIRMAHRVGALSANEMANALSRERQAALANVAALKSHTVAIHANNAAMRMASFQRTNLIFQLNDIAVSLASGMNPLMVFAQQGSQISQIYAGQGGVAAALRETADMAGRAASRFGRWGAVLAPVALGLGHIKSEAEAALRSSVTWGEVMTATFQTIWEGLQNTFGPAVSTLLDPLFYAFEKLSSAAVDVGELVINSFRAAYEDVKFIWNQFPNMMGAAFVGAVNFAIRELNSLIKRNADAVDQIIAAFNRIPGVDIPTIGASDQTIPEQRNPYAEELARAAQQRNADIESIMTSTPLRDFGSDVVDRIGTNRAQSRLADLANMDFSRSIQGATGLSQAVGGIATAAQQARSTVIDVNQQMMDARRATLAGFEQSGNQLRSMKSELKDIQATLAAAAQTPVADVFGRDINGASSAIEAAASSIQKVFNALDSGTMTARTAHESLELIRQSLHQLGGNTASVDAFINALINGNMRARDLESAVKSLSNSIQNIPDKLIRIGIQQYTVPSANGGTANVNVIGGNADFSYSQYQVGGGKTVGVSAGNGSYGGQSGYYYDSPYDMQTLQQMGRLSGTRAAGGPVSAGGTYLVGENGPELLTMSGAGNVTDTNSTAAILSGGRDTLSLIEDHLYNVVQELRIHTNYWETAESEFSEMVACLKSLKSAVSSGGGSYSGGSSYSRGSSRGSYGGSSGSSGGQSHLDPYSPYYFNAARNFAGTGGGRYDPVADAMLNGNVGALAGVGQGPGYFGGAYLSSINIGGAGSSPTLLDRLKRQVGFANNGQIMPGEDQKVEFFKRNKERVIIVDDNRVSDQRGAQPAKSDRPIQIINNFNGGNIGDARSRQAMEDQFRRAVQQVK